MCEGNKQYNAKRIQKKAGDRVLVAKTYRICELKQAEDILCNHNLADYSKTEPMF